MLDDTSGLLQGATDNVKDARSHRSAVEACFGTHTFPRDDCKASWRPWPDGVRLIIKTAVDARSEELLQ